MSKIAQAQREATRFVKPTAFSVMSEMSKIAQAQREATRFVKPTAFSVMSEMSKRAEGRYVADRPVGTVRSQMVEAGRQASFFFPQEASRRSRRQFWTSPIGAAQADAARALAIGFGLVPTEAPRNNVPAWLRRFVDVAAFLAQAPVGLASFFKTVTNNVQERWQATWMVRALWSVRTSSPQTSRSRRSQTPSALLRSNPKKQHAPPCSLPPGASFCMQG